MKFRAMHLYYTILKKALLAAMVLVLLAVLPALASWVHWKNKEADLLPYEVVASDQQLSNAEIVWVDARSKEDYEKEHATKAVILNEEDWDTMLGGVFEAWQPGKIIVVYCDSSCSASQKVAQRLRDMGIEPVYFLKGGYAAWKQVHSGQKGL